MSYAIVVFIAAVIVSVSVAIAYFRTRNKSALAMFAGALLAWASFSLGVFGPHTQDTVGAMATDSQRESAVAVGSHYVIKRPMGIVKPMFMLGLAVFTAGFVVFVLKRDSREAQ